MYLHVIGLYFGSWPLWWQPEVDRSMFSIRGALLGSGLCGTMRLE